MKKIVLLITLITQCLPAQTIQGTFPQAKNTEIVLKGFEGFDEKELTKTTIDSLGNFSLAYPKAYKGAALLQIQNASSVIVLLNRENFEIQWDNFQDFNTLKFINSPENEFFAKGIIINQEAEQKLAGLRYLLPLYNNVKTKESWLKSEVNIQEQTFEVFINKLPKNSYVKDYLAFRKFLGDVQLTNERYKELNRVKQHELTFTKIDFASDALWYSGLLKEILNSYYQVLELYQDKDIIANKCIEANNIWLKALKNQPIRQQEVAEFCFMLLEKKGLTRASEQIALSMLNKDNCQLTDKQTDLFEQYRKLAIGKTAPNIFFESKEARNKKQDIESLSNNFKLVVFGASWCPNCQKDYPSLVGKYKKLKEKHDLEVIYISIDTDKKVFEEYYKETPFITFCDIKGWETQAAKDYHVFATPTYILLDMELKILAKIQSPEHLEMWLQANTNK
jgi:thiol-disulfide isomerase/thioredoxin